VKSELIEAVQRLNPPGPDRKVRILAVDDDLLVLELLKAMLVETEFEIRGEADANEAFEQIKRQPPDLVILDLLMPIINGFEFLKMLRADPSIRDLPVLILSARTLTPGERADLAASAQAVLSKNSLQREALVAEIRRIEQLRTVLADPVTRLK
ncbi:MAG TPA: response regulator, partial [Anaerolineae bacterium]